MGRIGKEAKKINKIQKVLIEVNISGEQTKYGLDRKQVSSFISDFSLQYSIINATAFLALTPTVVLALLLQKYVVAGLTAGAVKG